ncbi:MAG TPA: S9 family peptidase, partial [Bacteroidales bacterium]
ILSLVIIFLLTIAFSNAQNSYTPELLWKLRRISELQISPDGKTLLYGVSTYKLEENKGERNLFTLPVSGGAPTQLTDIRGNIFNGEYRPDGQKIGYLAAESGIMQIWETGIKGENTQKISQSAENINGFSYSPDQKNLVLVKRVKLDKTVTDIYPDLPLADARIETDLMYRHWDTWSDFSYSHIFVAPYQDGKIGEAKDIMAGEPFESPMAPFGGMEQIAWSSDGTKLAYVCKKLKGMDYALSTNSDIYIYNLNDKTTTNISNGMPGYDQDPVFSPDGSKIVWRSMETPGYESDKDRIMIYDFASGKAKDYSANFDQNAGNFKWTKDGKQLYFISGTKGTEQVFVLNIAKNDISQVTHGDFDYQSIVIFGNQVIGLKMSMSMPTEIFRINPEKAEIQLSFVNRDILSQVKSANVVGRWITTTDKKKMLTWVIYPPDFDPAKKYPAILYCEGGPQSTVSQFFSYRWNFQLMAANGYIIVAPNRRGLPSFGKEWNDQIAGDYGGQNMLDYLTAIDTLAAEPYVDKDRLGCVGASYGGFSVFWLAGHHQKRFKAFIAHDGMFNLESQYLETEEMWFVNHDLGGAFWDKENAIAQKSYANSPHLFVQNWDTPIMVVHGGNDFRIAYTQGMSAYNAAKLRGLPAKFLYFPNENHWVLKPQNSVLWQREFFGWLDQWLK